MKLSIESVSVRSTLLAVAEWFRARFRSIRTSDAAEWWGWTLILWPVIWWAGLDQFFPLLFFIAVAGIVFLIRKSPLPRDPFLWIILGLAVWWLIPAIWVPSTAAFQFLKEASFIWTELIAMLVVFRMKKQAGSGIPLLRGLQVFAVTTSLASWIYILGAWRGRFISLVGSLLPRTLIKESAFWQSVASHSFGRQNNQMLISPIRLTGFSLGVTELSLVLVLLIPLILWIAWESRRGMRVLWVGVAFSLCVALFFTESRTAYAGLLCGFGLALLLGLLSLRRTHPRRFRLLSIGLLLFGVVTVAAVVMNFPRLFQFLVVEWRGASYTTRMEIYLRTIELFWSKPITGWGMMVRIPGLRSVFSAGSHSSELGMLFQHGIVGFVLYLGIGAMIWWKAIVGWLHPQCSGIGSRVFWTAMMAGMLAFQIRALTAVWWWDQSVAFILWTIWGLVVLAPLAADSDPPVSAVHA